MHLVNCLRKSKELTIAGTMNGQMRANGKGSCTIFEFIRHCLAAFILERFSGQHYKNISGGPIPSFLNNYQMAAERTFYRLGI